MCGFFIPKSKGGKKRTVAVSNELLVSLKRYRKYLGLSELPSPNDNTPIFMKKRKGSRGISTGMIHANIGIRRMREVINDTFEVAADLASKENLTHDAEIIRTMTPHSIRHTGISHDININQRPLSHVQADAGHDSIDTTSKYLHTTIVERHETAQRKELDTLRSSR